MAKAMKGVSKVGNEGKGSVTVYDVVQRNPSKADTIGTTAVCS